jgi:hypothetical protein
MGAQRAKGEQCANCRTLAPDKREIATGEALMARYRFLAAAYIDGRVFQPGEQADLRADWVPGPYVEPLDAEAARAFFDAGPMVLGLVRQQWSDLVVTRYPVTYWRPTDATKETWELVGLGSGFGTKRWTSDADKSAP